MHPRWRTWIIPLGFAFIVLALWLFPTLWYTETGDGTKAWFSERAQVEGWDFESLPISQAAERSLVADRTVNGEFRNQSGDAIRVFSAKRFLENPNEIGLFVHTPDRCWIEGGWKFEPIAPDLHEINLHGLPLALERRLFHIGANRELVYFFGLVDGRPLPYRLDHNLSSSMRASARTSNGHFWSRVWNSFTSRRQLSGPKQFYRISTPVAGNDIASADQRLQSFLPQWLAPGVYKQERAAFQAGKKL